MAHVAWNLFYNALACCGLQMRPTMATLFVDRGKWFSARFTLVDMVIKIGELEDVAWGASEPSNKLVYAKEVLTPFDIHVTFLYFYSTVFPLIRARLRYVFQYAHVPETWCVMATVACMTNPGLHVFVRKP